MKGKSNNISRSIVDSFCLDYIINEKSVPELSEKYNFSPVLCHEIVIRMQLVKKRDTYRKRVLDKALNRCATYQSKIIGRATEMLSKHIEALSVKQRQQTQQMLSSNEIKDVMGILQIISKEYRLDNNQPTDNVVKQVQVLFPDNYASSINKKPDVVTQSVNVTNNNIEQLAEEEVKKELSGIVETDNEEIKVEIDDDILSPL
jgi:hypothetical protein